MSQICNHLLDPRKYWVLKRDRRPQLTQNVTLVKDVGDPRICKSLKRWRPRVGIEPRRAHHVITDKVTFPRAPLQSRKVGFPDSGFDLGFPRKAFPRRVKLKRSLAIHPNPFWFTSQLVLNIMAPPTCVVDHARTAKCPELLCPSQALLMTGWRLAPPRRALPLLPRSYELMRQTSSLLWNSCIHTYLPRSLQVAANPCWKPVLPDVISASLSQDA